MARINNYNNFGFDFAVVDVVNANEYYIIDYTMSMNDAITAKKDAVKSAKKTCMEYNEEFSDSLRIVNACGYIIG